MCCRCALRCAVQDSWARNIRPRQHTTVVCKQTTTVPGIRPPSPGTHAQQQQQPQRKANAPALGPITSMLATGCTRFPSLCDHVSTLKALNESKSWHFMHPCIYQPHMAAFTKVGQSQQQCMRSRVFLSLGGTFDGRSLHQLSFVAMCCCLAAMH